MLYHDAVLVIIMSDLPCGMVWSCLSVIWCKKVYLSFYQINVFSPKGSLKIMKYKSELICYYGGGGFHRNDLNYTYSFVAHVLESNCLNASFSLSRDVACGSPKLNLSIFLTSRQDYQNFLFGLVGHSPASQGCNFTSWFPVSIWSC